MDAATEVKFDALRNALYHSFRQRWLDFVNRMMSLIVVLSGAVAVSDLFGGFKYFALAASIFGALQLVYDFGGAAKEHSFLQQRFYAVIADIEGNINPTEATIAKWKADLVAIYGTEPPTFRALDAIAYNAAADALGTGYGIDISKFRYTLLKQLYPFNGTSFPAEKKLTI